MKFLRKVSVVKKKPELQIVSKTLWQNQNTKVYLINAVLSDTPCMALKFSGPEHKLHQATSLYYKAFRFLYPKIDLTFFSYTSSAPKFLIIIPFFHQVFDPKAQPITSPKALKSFFKSLIRFYYIPLPISLSQELYTNTSSTFFIQIPKIQDSKIVSEDFLINSLKYCSFSSNIRSFSELRTYVYSLYNKRINVPSRLGIQDLIGYCKENFGLGLADTGSILALEVNKVGTMIATGGLDGFVRVWDVIRNLEICNVKSHPNAVYHLKFSGNSQLLLSGGNDKNLCFLSLGKKKRLYKRKAHEQYINCISISPNDRLGITGGDDGIVQLWDLVDFCILSSLKGHISSWRELPNVITSDISQIHNIGITGGSDGYVRIWRLDWKTLEGSLTSHSSVVPYIPNKKFSFLPDTEDRYYENVTCVKFLKNSKFFASGGEDGFIMIWDLLMKEKVAEFGVHRSGRFDGVKVLAIASNDSMMASGGVDGKVALLNLETYKCEQVFDAHLREGGVTSICFSPDDKLLITAGTDSSIGIINIKEKALETYVNCHANKIVGVRVLGTESIVSFSLDGFAKIWNLSEMKCVFQLQGHKGLITALVINPFIEEVVSGGFSGYLKFWKINSKKSSKEKAAHKGWVSFLALGPSGKFFVSGGSDGVLKIWDSLTKVLINKTQCGNSALINILVANNGEGIMAACQDNKLYYWDTEMTAMEVDRFSKFLEIKRKFKEFHKFIDYIN